MLGVIVVRCGDLWKERTRRRRGLGLSLRGDSTSPSPGRHRRAWASWMRSEPRRQAFATAAGLVPRNFLPAREIMTKKLLVLSSFFPFLTSLCLSKASTVFWSGFLAATKPCGSATLAIASSMVICGGVRLGPTAFLGGAF